MLLKSWEPRLQSAFTWLRRMGRGLKRPVNGRRAKNQLLQCVSIERLEERRLLTGTGQAVISVEPHDVGGLAGQSVKFIAVATDNTELTAQWQVSTNGVNWAPYTGQPTTEGHSPSPVTTTLNLVVDPALDGKQFRAVFSSDGGNLVNVTDPGTLRLATITYWHGGAREFTDVQVGDPLLWSNPLNWSNGTPDQTHYPMFLNTVPQYTLRDHNGNNPVTLTTPIDFNSHVDRSYTIPGFNLAYDGGLTVQQPLELTGATEWDIGTLVVAPGTVLVNDATSTLHLGNPDQVSVRGGGELLNNGMIAQSAGFLRVGIHTTLTNALGGTIDLQSETGITGDFVDGAGTLRNHGTLEKTSGLNSIITAIGFMTDGVVNVATGDLTITPLFVPDGDSANYINPTLNVGLGAELDLTGGAPEVTTTGTLTGSGSGHVVLSSGKLRAATGGARFNFPDGFFQWTGGSIVGQTDGWTNAGTITLAGAEIKSLEGTLHNQHKIIETTDSLQIPGGALLDNQIGATFEMQSNGGIIPNGQNGAGSFRNNGQIVKSGGSDTSLIFLFFTTIAGPNEQGSIRLDTGHLTIRPIDVTNDPFGNPEPANYVGYASPNSGNSMFMLASGTTLDLTGGLTPTVTGTLNSSGPLDDHGNPIGSGRGQVVLSSGKLMATPAGATLAFNVEPLQWTGGNLQGPWINTGVLVLADGEVKTVTTALRNQGLITQKTTISTDGLQIGPGAVIDNESDASFLMDTDAGINGAGSFLNNGYLVKFGGTGTSLINTHFTSIAGDGLHGAIQLNQGNMVISSFDPANDLLGNQEPANYIGGNFMLASGTTLDLTGGVRGLATGVLNFTGAGQGIFSQGTLEATASGATLHDADAPFLWTGGALHGNWTNTGLLTTADGTDKVIVNVLHNQGTMRETGVDSLQLGSGSLLDNQPGAFFKLESEGGTNGGGSFLNDGTLEETMSTSSASSMIATRFTNNVDNVNAGLIHVIQGNLVIGLRGTAEGQAAEFNGANFVLDQATTVVTLFTTTFDDITATGLLKFTGGSEINFAQGVLNAVSPATLHAVGSTFQWMAGNLVGDWTNTGLMNLADGGDKVIIGGSKLRNQGSISQTASDNLQLRGNALLDNQVGAIYDIQSQGGISGAGGYGTGDFLNNGTLKKSNADSSVTITANFTTNVSPDGHDSIHVAQGTLVIAPANPAANQAVNYNGAVIMVDLGATFDPTGGAVVTATGILKGSGLGQVDLCQGKLQAGAGGVTLNFLGALLQWTGGTLDGGSDGLTNAGAMNLNSGNLPENGTESFVHNFVNNGFLTIQPSNTLAINGDFTQGANATLDLKLGGKPETNQFGRVTLTAGHTAVLGGTLETDLAGNYIPVAGDTFTVLTYSDNQATAFSDFVPPASAVPFHARVTGTNVTVSSNITPVFTSGHILSVPENQDAVITVTTNANPVSYSITGGVDQDQFSITSDGILTFITTPDFETPTDAGQNNQYALQVTADDGQGGVSVQDITINVTPVNDNLPIIATLSTFNVSEGTTAVGNILATDLDLPTQSLTFAVTGGADAGKFLMTNTVITNIDVGLLTFISPPDFEGPTDADGNNVYLLQVTASDGNGGLSSVQNIAVTVTPVNDNSPIFTSPTTFSVLENSAAVGTVAATDADRPVQNLTYSVTGGADAAKFALSGAGVVTFVTAPDFEVPTDAGGNNVYDLQVTADDGNGGLTVQNIAVTVTSVNDNVPIFTSLATFSVLENSAAVGTVAATDADRPVQNLTYSVTGGADAAKFALSGAGVVTFVTAPDFEVPTDAGGNNVYDLQVTADDGNGGLTVQNIAVTVTPVNDNSPIFTSPATFSVLVNSTAVGTVAATDADRPLQNLTYSVTGGADAARFAMTSTGVLTFVMAPNIEVPTDAGGNNVYDLQVTANDGNGGLTAQNIAVTVTQANVAPILANPGPATTFFGNLKTPVKVMPTLSVTDADGTATLATIVVTLPLGAAKKNPDIVTLPGLSPLGTRVDTIVSGRLVITITLKSGATNAAVQTMLRGMIFQTTSAGLKVSSRNFQLQVTDRTGLHSNLLSQTVPVVKKAPKPPRK
jgi:hypothetical protein